jgi:hypothetical protein
MVVTDFFKCLRVVLKRLCVAFLSSIAQRYNKNSPATTTVEGKGRRNEREREKIDPTEFSHPLRLSIQVPKSHPQICNIAKYAISRQVPNHILKSVTSQNPAISHALKSKPGDDISTDALFTCGNCATLFFLPHMGLAILN